MRAAPLNGAALGAFPLNDLKSEHEELIRRMNARGFAISSLQEWISGPTPQNALPFLVDELEVARSEALREIIARALTDRRFKAAASALVSAFRRTEDQSALWAIGNALATVGFPKKLWGEILSIAADPAFGGGRQMIIWRLHRIKRPETVPLLKMLLHEPGVDAFAVTALGYAGDLDCLETLESTSLEGRSVLFKREIPKAIKRIKTRHGALVRRNKGHSFCSLQGNAPRAASTR